MACPYCGFGNWEENDTIDIREDGWSWVAVYRNCRCDKCDKIFVTKKWFRNDDVCEYMTEDEYRQE